MITSRFIEYVVPIYRETNEICRHVMQRHFDTLFSNHCMFPFGSLLMDVAFQLF
jgi:hypothetical protein